MPPGGIIIIVRRDEGAGVGRGGARQGVEVQQADRGAGVGVFLLRIGGAIRPGGAVRLRGRRRVVARGAARGVRLVREGPRLVRTRRLAVGQIRGGRGRRARRRVLGIGRRRGGRAGPRPPRPGSPLGGARPGVAPASSDAGPSSSVGSVGVDEMARAGISRAASGSFAAAGAGTAASDAAVIAPISGRSGGVCERSGREARASEARRRVRRGVERKYVS